MQALLLGRRLALVGLAISVVLIVVTFSGIGQTTPGLGQAILAVGGITAGLTTIALMLLATPPPRTSLAAHLAAGALVAAAVACVLLGGIVWAAQAEALKTEAPPVSALNSPLLFAGMLFTAAAAGLLVAQLFPPEARRLRLGVAIAPVIVVALLGAFPDTAAAIGQLGLAVSNLALGVIFIAPIGALAAYVVTTDKIRKRQSRAAA